MASAAEIHAMRRAIELAALGRATASPRPLVGCVILDAGGARCGEGFARFPIEPHAEIRALRAAGSLAHGGVAVVTLEPCHRAGAVSCSRALVRAGVARVVYAVADHNPAAADGALVLQNAGIDVEGGILQAEASAVNETWITATRFGRPYVVWAYCSLVDHGRTITGTPPRPTPRDEECPETRRLRATADIVLNDASRRSNTGSSFVHIRDSRDHMSLFELLRHLYERRIRSILLEGEATLAALLLTQGLVDRVVGCVAPPLADTGRPGRTTRASVADGISGFLRGNEAARRRLSHCFTARGFRDPASAATDLPKPAVELVARDGCAGRLRLSGTTYPPSRSGPCSCEHP